MQWVNDYVYRLHTYVTVSMNSHYSYDIITHMKLNDIIHI
jgi:hypothetical protein